MTKSHSRSKFFPGLFASAARNDCARVNKTDLGRLRKTRFTLTAQKKCDQLFVSVRPWRHDGAESDYSTYYKWI
jgi:hypothetical protein